MQEILVWAIAICATLGIMLPYAINFHRRQSLALRRRREAQKLGIDKPRAQYPMVDPAICIGCGSCVKSCPEGDVLAVIHGTAVVINGQRCVGHGCCERACPVDALVVALGDTSHRSDIPVLSEFKETVVPGLFIAGELGGLSLIRHAINQGRMVIQRIAQSPERVHTDDVTDVLIVGAGPAGLSAALASIEEGLTYVVVDERDVGGTILHYPRRKLVMTQPVEIPLYGWLKKLEYTKEELMEIWQTTVSKFNVDVRTQERIEAITKQGDVFDITTSKGAHHARHVVLALGRRGTPRKLGVPGEESTKVMYQLVDAQSYTGNHILVVGGGDSAIEAAIGLARQTDNIVSISYRKSGFFRVKRKNEERISALIDEGMIKPIFESNVSSIEEKSVTLKTLQGELKIPNDYVFVFVGGIPPFGLLSEMGVTFGGQTEAEKSVAAMPATDIRPAIVARPAAVSDPPVEQRAIA